MLKETKRNYLFSVILAFIITFVAYSMIFQQENNVGGKYIVVLLFYLGILTFTYYLMKLVFFTQSRNKKDGIKLEELSKDQEEIEKTH